MRLYHGSNIEISNIDLNKCRPYKDFGKGYYLTEIRDQAEKMASRVARIYGGRPCITVYEFDEAAPTDGDIKVRKFELPIKEWALFVIHNRSREFKDIASEECNLDNKYDLVIGPVANDDLALLFRQFSNGLIDVDTLVREMKFKKLTNQYSFHTKKAIAYLRKEEILRE